MCLGVPGRVIGMVGDHPDLASVDVEGVVRRINVALMEDDPPRPGDWVLIHLGFALERMTDDEVESARSTLSVLGEGDPEQPEATDLGERFPDGSFRDDPFAPSGYGEVTP